MLLRDTTVSWIVLLVCFGVLRLSESQSVPQAEADALQQIATEMGATYWRFNRDICEVEEAGISLTPPSASEGYVDCNCNYNNNTVCHITRIVLKSLNLPGILPPSLVNLPYIEFVDFAYNLLTGTIPSEWALTRLNSISVLVNRLSGEIPRHLGNITTLTYLNLEGNQFSGSIPSDIGRLTNLKTLMLSSNPLTGPLPMSFSELINLNDFRVNDNNLTGRIPDFIQNWRQLTRLEMLASGLEGPIPSNISLLNLLVNLRISDISSPPQQFPNIRSLAVLATVVLRNCNITGEIPSYVWRQRLLQMLDVSFNRLQGIIPNNIARTLGLVFAAGNMLSGTIPDSLLKAGSNIDLSYNNFSWSGPDETACQPNRTRFINLFKASSSLKTLQQILPCDPNVRCPRYRCSLHINCGGDDLTMMDENNRKIKYEGDNGIGGDVAGYLSANNWGFKSTGDFLDESFYENSRSITIAPTKNLTGVYNSARLSPLSLTYFHYCLENGNYNVALHFAEILFANDSTYNRLGTRMFDIYMQGTLVWKNFNIEEEARGVQKPLVRHSNVTVTDGTLEIRFYWASKGTTRIPNRGDYGSLVSAISVNPNFKVCSDGKRKNRAVVIIAPILGVFSIFLIAGIIWWRFFRIRKQLGKEFEGLELQTVSFTLKQIRTATNNFDTINKIGEGGFGSVYKGQLADGRVIAVKQLSAKSRQGNREFLNEIGMISCLQHPNLVKLYGCCIEFDQLLVVYEYMDNNSLAHVLFDSKESQMMLDWATRFHICIGIAKGLAFLHEESRLKIVHRDIKATNVLLDKDLNAKISDFGLARLNDTPDEKSHISTKVAGTIGYMAPEYALWGYLTDKVDVYSFGVVILEVVSGKSNNNYMPSYNFVCLLDWACHLQETNNIDELIDERLGCQINREEIERTVEVAVLCTNATPSLRPTMSEVVQMLEGTMAIPDEIPKGSTYTNDVRFKAMKDFHHDKQSSTTNVTQASQAFTQTGEGFSSSTDGLLGVSSNIMSC